MAIYQGVNGVNREIKQIFQGVDGVNREIKERWECVGGVNRRVFNKSLFDGYSPLLVCEHEGYHDFNDLIYGGVAISHNTTNCWAVRRATEYGASIKGIYKVIDFTKINSLTVKFTLTSAGGTNNYFKGALLKISNATNYPDALHDRDDAFSKRYNSNGYQAYDIDVTSLFGLKTLSLSTIACSLTSGNVYLGIHEIIFN